MRASLEMDWLGILDLRSNTLLLVSVVFETLIGRFQYCRSNTLVLFGDTDSPFLGTTCF